MRSSRAAKLLQSRRLPLCRISQSSLRYSNFREGYCTACEPSSGPIKFAAHESLDPTHRDSSASITKLPLAPALTSNPVAEKVSRSDARSTNDPPSPPVDHRKLAVEQELYINSPYSPGSPIFLPNGTKIFNRLSNFLRSQYTRYGFQEVITPSIYKKSLWEKSGHWESYADDMYAVVGRGATMEREGLEANEDEAYGLKPMNCPGHCLIFASKKRSYKELPLRYADFSPLHRNEIQGALSGLTRVRRFHQDDGHIFCRPSQIRDEITQTLEFVKYAFKVLDLGPYRLALSTRPAEGSIGNEQEWENAETALKDALDASEQEWTVNDGDGAFYGPKIDIILKDNEGKEHQTATIQLDFQLPKRFGLEYQAPAAEAERNGQTTTDPELLKLEGPVTPVLIHRAVLGSVERIMALLIEHHNGRWPYWLNPNQMIILTVNDMPETVQYAQDCIYHLQSPVRRTAPLPTQSLDPPGIDLDASPRKLQKKISEAKRKGYSLIAVVGPQSVRKGNLTVDFSGIKNEHILSTMFTMRRALAENKSPTGTMPETAPGKINFTELPIATTAELRQFQIKPQHLRDVLVRLERGHQ